jgi:16S rRNA (guanine966-N2)-methyltransferase
VGLRPTADRTRETLFNWLAPLLPGARCLDLFAGSGALGFEACSRGAARVVLVEQAPAVVRQLRQNAATLGAKGVEVVQADALRWLERTDPPAAGGPFDVVFLDPPFADGLLAPAIAALDLYPWLSPGARIYWEAGAGDASPALPADMIQLRERRAGQVRFGLAAVAVPNDDPDTP